MSYFIDLPIRLKLIAIVALPLMLAGGFMFDAAVKEEQLVSSLIESKKLIFLSVSSNDLVHELQKERGMTAVYVGSQGRTFAKELSDQKLLANEGLAKYQKTVEQLMQDNDSAALEEKLDSINILIQRLSNIRQQVSKNSLSKAKAIAFYTGLNSQLLNLTFGIANVVQDKDISQAAIAYFYYVQGKERAGIERAILSGVFADGKADQHVRSQFVSLEVEQKRFYALFKQLSDSELVGEVDAITNSKAAKEVDSLREIASYNLANSNITAKYWYKMSTERIEALKRGEDTISKSLEKFVNDKKVSAQSGFYTFLAISFTLLAITLSLIYLTQKLISGQLNALSKGMLDLGEHSNLATHVPPMSQDDLGKLTQLFNKTVVHIRTLVGDMKQAGGSLQTSSSELNNISQAVEGQVDLGLEQAEMVAVAMNQMGATVQSVATNCATAAASSKDANTSTGEGRQLLQVATSNMQNLNETLEKTRDSIHQMEANSNEIGTILDVIKGIAEQTNLLALNAAIEAARAGEQGRGFAVVADEVRTLAQKTQQSTGQIEEMILVLQQGSQDAVQFMTESEDKAKFTCDSVEKIMDKIEVITEQVDKVNELNTHTASATEQQSATAEEINRNIIAMQTLYRENKVSVDKMGTTAEAIAGLAGQLTSSVDKFKMP